LIIILALTPISVAPDRIGDPVRITLAGSAEQRQQQSASKDNETPSIYPIEGLNPCLCGWSIKARVIQKSDIKTWSNRQGEGRLFDVTLMDETGAIRGAGFNAVVDKLYPRLEEGKVYFISKARVNPAKKKFSNLTHDYELSFQRDTEVEEVTS
jgi:replication factor A1